MNGPELAWALVRALASACDNPADHHADDLDVVLLSVDVDGRMSVVRALRAQLRPCVVDRVVAPQHHVVPHPRGDYVSILGLFDVLPVWGAQQCHDSAVGETRLVHRVVAYAQAQIRGPVEDPPHPIVVDPLWFLRWFDACVPYGASSSEIVRFVQWNASRSRRMPLSIPYITLAQPFLSRARRWLSTAD